MDLDLKEIYKSAGAKIAELEGKRAEIDRQLAQVRQLSQYVGRMLGEKEIPKPPSKYQGKGLKAAISLVLQAANEPLSPTEVCERLTENQFTFAKRANPVSTVGITLKRMAGAEEVINHGSDRRPSYSWKWPSSIESVANG